MKVRLLGTGAAHGVPAFYSNSRVSNYARKHQGKDIRTRTAALVDDHLKIDIGPDTLGQLHRDGLSAMDWTALVITHGHDDHLTLSELQYALFPFNDMEHLGFTIYANVQVCERIHEQYPAWPIDVVETKSFCAFNHLGTLITPIKANHKLDEDSQNLLLQKDGRTFLYATDTGTFLPETVEFLKDFTIDCMVIECTDGFVPQGYYGHLAVDSCVEQVHELRHLGILTSDSRVLTTHHSDQGDATHEELEAALNPHKIDVGYDGLELNF